MAASKILSTFETIVKPAITLASLANGAGRISDVIDNTTVRASMAFVFLRYKTNAAPTANTPVKVYLVRRSNDGTTDIADNALGTADAAVATEPTQAECIGSIIVSASATTTFEKCFIAYDLTPKYSIVVWNATGQTNSTTESDHELEVLPVTPEGQ